jgi:hypothetical protein
VIAVDRNRRALAAATAPGADHVLTADSSRDIPGSVQVGLLPPVSGHPRVPMARVIAWELDLPGSHDMASFDTAAPAGMTMIDPRRPSAVR